MNKLKVAAIGVIALLAIVVVLQNMQAVREVNRVTSDMKCGRSSPPRGAFRAREV